MRQGLERILSAATDPVTGGLRLRASGHPGREILLSSWAEGLDPFILQRGKTMPLDVPPEVDLLALQSNGPAQGFVLGIPEQIRAQAGKFTYRQILVLRLVRQSREAEDLLHCSPLLLWLLAGAVNPSTFPVERARDVLCWKRKEILREILNGHTESQVRLLGRMDAPTFDRKAYDLVVRTLQSPFLVEHLRHFKTVRVPLLECLGDCPELAGLRLFRHENEADSPSIHRVRHVRALFRDCLRFSDAHGEANLLRTLRGCRSVSELSGLHRSLLERYDTVFLRHRAMIQREEDAARLLRENVERYERELRELHREKERRRRAAAKPGEFPLPPYPGTELIVPIRTPAELRVEGEAMGSCVGGIGYVRKGMSGASAYYRVYFPERCTLELRRPDLHWEVKELKAERNAAPRQQTRKFVTEWLAASEAEGRRG
jgi:hypothetical protein